MPAISLGHEMGFYEGTEVPIACGSDSVTQTKAYGLLSSTILIHTICELDN